MSEQTVGDFVSLQRGQSYKGALLGEPGPVLLGLGTIHRNGGFRADSLKTYGGDSPDKLLVHPGDIYVSLKDVTHSADLLGAVACVPTSVAVGRLTQDTVRLDIHNDRIQPMYLYWLLRSPQFRAYCRTRGTGTTNLDLSRDAFLGYRFQLPHDRDQRAISEVLGALDDKIAANAKLVLTVEALMTSLAATATHSAPVRDLAHQSTATLRPEQFDDEVAHFSLPAFDGGVRPDVAAGESIKSNKFVIDSPLVLMSKLNPRIPRIWDVPKPPETMGLASTEFVALKPIDVGSSELWSVLAQPDVTAGLTGKVAGTSGSHQRVKPADVLSLPVRDPRTLEASKRQAVVNLGLIRYERRAESARLATMRDALLPLLMSGKIRVKDAEGVVEGVV